MAKYNSLKEALIDATTEDLLNALDDRGDLKYAYLGGLPEYIEDLPAMKFRNLMCDIFRVQRTVSNEKLIELFKERIH